MKELLEELPEPKEGELVARVKATKSRNLLEVRVRCTMFLCALSATQPLFAIPGRQEHEYDARVCAG